MTPQQHSIKRNSEIPSFQMQMSRHNSSFQAKPKILRKPFQFLQILSISFTKYSYLGHKFSSTLYPNIAGILPQTFAASSCENPISFKNLILLLSFSTRVFSRCEFKLLGDFRFSIPNCFKNLCVGRRHNSTSENRILGHRRINPRDSWTEADRSALRKWKMGAMSVGSKLGVKS